jgi:osmoprotectant transport system permease protein
MQIRVNPYTYFLANQQVFWAALSTHLRLSLSALLISVLVCVPLGIWISRRARTAQYIINTFNALRVLPSLVILFFALPYLGLGFQPALIALTILAFPPVLINTYTGLRNVDRSVIEAARGMGMAPSQVLQRVEIPLALPAIVAGIRTAAVEVVSSATLAAFIGGGGLGDFITRGYSLGEPGIMLVGAIPVALLAIIFELALGGLQQRFSTSAA